VYAVNPPLGTELIHRSGRPLTLWGVVPEIDPSGMADQPRILNLLQIRPQGSSRESSPGRVIDRPHQLIERIVRHQMIG
jgi:hypothetical protein